MTRKHDNSERASDSWRDLSLSDLTDHIIATHHRYLRDELERLQALGETIRGNAPVTVNFPAIASVLRRIASNLVKHLDKEEQVLFPLIRSLDYASRQQGVYAGGVDRWMDEMRHDHDATEREFEELRRLTDTYDVPDDGSDDYAELMHALAALDRNVTVHNDKQAALFTRAAALDASLRRAAPTPDGDPRRDMSRDRDPADEHTR